MYLNKDWWYTSVTVNKKTLARSLKTKNKKEAKLREAKIKRILWERLELGQVDTRKTPMSNNAMVEMFLREKRKEGVSPKTYHTYKHILRPWCKSNFIMPNNQNTASSYKTHLNSFFRWSMKNFKIKFDLFKNIKPSVRSRVFDYKELSLLKNDVYNCGVNVEIGGLSYFANFLQFAYYTGCRRGEINRLKWDDINLKEEKMIVRGKTGERFVKLNTQARDILVGTGGYLWNYKLDYITKKFKQCMFSLGIDNVIFHDIRRTFGYNLIKQGMPIFKVSKLLGHKSVVTTERHYAPLLATDVEDFVL